MKRKLLLFAVLMMVGALGCSVYAQKDVTAKYIKNANLSSLSGWTNKNFNTPVKGNNTIGYASESYAGWDNVAIHEYSLTQEITLPKGKYTLVNYSFFRYGQSYDYDNRVSLAYLKAGDKEVAIKTLGSIEASGYANSQAEGANVFDSKMYRNTLDFEITADNTKIEIGLYGTFDDLIRSWVIAGMFELIDNGQEATMDSPFDVTGYLTNPGFEYRDMSGWTTENIGELSNSYIFQTQRNNSFANKAGDFYAEAWQASGALSDRKMSQSLRDLPNGFYQLSAYVSYGSAGAYLKLNEKATEVTAGNSGKYTVGCVINDGNLTVEAGVRGGETNYLCFDRFTLAYCGDIAKALKTLCESVTKYQGIIPAAYYESLAQKVAGYNKTYSDADDYINAIAAVNALFAEADKLLEPYAEYKSMYDNIQALADAKPYKEIVANAHKTLENALSDGAANAERSTTAEALEGVCAALKAAGVQYAKDADPMGDAKFDLTFMLVNPNLEGLTTWAKCEGWYTEQSDGNSQVMENESKAYEGKSYFYEYWSDPAKDNGLFTLYTTMNLAPGVYNMSCLAFAEDQYAGKNVRGVKFFANDTEGSTISSTTLMPASIEFVQTAEGEVKVGLKAVAGNTCNWMGIGYVELFEVAPKEAKLSDTDTQAPAAGAYAKLTSDRKLLKGLNTIVLPFATTKDELRVAQVLKFNGTENVNGKVRLLFSEVEELSPNTPYAVFVDADQTLPVFENKTVAEPNDLTAAGEEYSFVGTYSQFTNSNSPIVAGDYVAGNIDFEKANGGNGLKAYRAYMKKVGSSSDEVETSINGFVIDGIQLVETSENQTSESIYNLNGQKVSKALKGVYIINGKKVVVK